MVEDTFFLDLGSLKDATYIIFYACLYSWDIWKLQENFKGTGVGAYEKHLKWRVSLQGCFGEI